MENKDVDLTGNGEKWVPVTLTPPKVEFNVLGNTINLEEFLSSDYKKRTGVLQGHGPNIAEERPDEAAAQCLLWGLQRSHVTIEEYKDTMPKLLQFAAKEGGGFDKDFISITIRAFDKVWARMTNGQSIDRFGSVNFDKHIPNRREFFSRAYGRVEAIKDFIWDNPAMAPKKQQLIEDANRGLPLTRPNYPRSMT